MQDGARGDDAGVNDGVDDALAGAVREDESSLAQDGQVLRNVGFAQVQQVGELLDGEALYRQRVEDLEPDGISHEPVDAGVAAAGAFRER